MLSNAKDRNVIASNAKDRDVREWTKPGASLYRPERPWEDRHHLIVGIVNETDVLFIYNEKIQKLDVDAVVAQRQNQIHNLLDVTEEMLKSNFSLSSIARVTNSNKICFVKQKC